MANNSYTVDYAPTNKAGCKFSQCKIKIEKGALRIGKSFPSDRFSEGGASHEYYHPKCWFEAQKKTKKTTKKIENEDDMQGFDIISSADQELINDLLKHRNDAPLYSPKKKAKKTDGGGGGGGTPKKQNTKQVYIDSDEENNKTTTKPKSSNNNNTNTNNKNKTNGNKAKTNTESDAESEDLEKDAWVSVASNGSRVAKVLNSTDITQVSVLILASASSDAIKRAAGQEDSEFQLEFGGDPDAYLQWLAGTGVLWISTDFDDAGFMSPGLWSDTSSQIVRQIFMQKPKKGLVVVMWGPETKHFKNEIKKHYQDTMGTVKYRAIEGPTPLNSAFNAKDELSKIDDARTLLSMHALHWWPFEGEVAQKKQALKEAGGKKKGSSQKVVGDGGVLWVLECSEEEGIRVDLTGGPMEIGRGVVNNKKISRKQCEVDTLDDGIELTPLGVNPMTMSRAGSEDVEILSRNEKYTLNEGDSFTLCGEQYRFVVQRPTVSHTTENTTKQSTKPVKQPSIKIDADEGEGEKTKKIGATEGEAEDEEQGNGANKTHDKEDKGEEKEDEQSEKQGVKRKGSDITTTTTTTTSSGKKTPQGSAESDSATVPFSAAGYDSPEESKAKGKKKADVKIEEAEEPVNDEEIARKLQEQLDKEAKAAAKSKTPKSKNNTPDKDEVIARKLQDKFNNESGGGGKKKRKQEDDNDDGEVNWAAKVKKQKKGKKGGSDDDDDDDDDWAVASVEEDEDSDEDYQEEGSDDDNKHPKKKGSKLPPCKYGSSCYRTNPEHRKSFSHPK